MKKLLKSLAILLCGTAVLVSCDYDINDPYGVVPDQALEMIATTYPGVYVEWEKENGMYKADLTQNGVSIEVYFTKKGAWSRTETDFYGTLSDAITQYIQTKYSTYRVDSVDFVETPTTEYYKIELERGEKDVYLRITEQGTVL